LKLCQPKWSNLKNDLGDSFEAFVRMNFCSKNIVGGEQLAVIDVMAWSSGIATAGGVQGREIESLQGGFLLKRWP
jgi:hypothetical protein